MLLMSVAICFGFTNAYSTNVNALTVKLLGMPIYELTKSGTEYLGKSIGIYMGAVCGICIEHDQNRGLQRWNFPFKSLEIAKLYLRTADYTTKKSCGIYEIKSKNGRLSCKIFADSEDLRVYLRKNKDKFEVKEL